MLGLVHPGACPRSGQGGSLTLVGSAGPTTGFTKEGLLRQRRVTKGEAKDVEIYGLSESNGSGGRPAASRIRWMPPLPIRITRASRIELAHRPAVIGEALKPLTTR